MKLTQAEEQVMMILWQLEAGFVNDVIAQMPEPKPAYNTVSTIIRILEQKGFVDHEALGKSHRYFPTVTRKAYRKNVFGKLFDDYFGASYESLVAFFMKEQNLTVAEMEEILNRIKTKQDEKSDH